MAARARGRRGGHWYLGQTRRLEGGAGTWNLGLRRQLPHSGGGEARRRWVATRLTYGREICGGREKSEGERGGKGGEVGGLWIRI